MQSSLQISTTPPLAGSVMVAAINDALESMATRNSGTSTPAVTYSFMQYADTVKGVVFRRNTANTSDILDDTLAETLVQDRSADTPLSLADHKTVIRATGTFTQTFNAVANLADGWSVMYRNVGTGVITLDPNGSETIDSAASITLPAGASCIIVCNGTEFNTISRPSAGGNLTRAFNDAITTVASAASPDIWTGTGGKINYTGTVTATGFAAAPQAGASRTLILAAAAPFTAGANMLIDGYSSGQTMTLAAGDRVEVIALTTTQFRLRAVKADGTAVVQSSITGNVKNLVIKNNSTNPNYQLDIACDEIVLKNGSGNAYLASAVSLTLDMTVSGLGGLRTGLTEASSTYYYPFVGYNGTSIVGWLDSSSTSPTVPSGVLYWASAYGAGIYNDGSSNFVKYYQADRDFWVGEVTITTSLPTTSYTSLSLAAAIPPTAKAARISTNFRPDSPSTSPMIYVAPSAADDLAQKLDINSGSAGATSTQMSSLGNLLPMLTAQTMYYKRSGTAPLSGEIYCNGGKY